MSILYSQRVRSCHVCQSSWPSPCGALIGPHGSSAGIWLVSVCGDTLVAYSCSQTLCTSSPVTALVKCAAA